MFRSINFHTIVAWLPNSNQPRVIPTLGRKSFIICSKNDIDTIHVIGSTGQTLSINEDFWNNQCAIINDMRENNPTQMERGIYYSGGRNRNFGPSVPAICREYCIEHNIN